MYRVLCVEDELDFREDIAEFLRMQNFEVAEASNGAEALDILLREPAYDVVLCDIMMPDMGGYDLLREVRKHMSALQHVPFIFLSALNNKQNIVEGRGWGCDDYITKPIDFEVLLATVQGRIERTRATQFILQAQKQGLTSRLSEVVSQEMAAPFDALSEATQLLLKALPKELPKELRETVALMCEHTRAKANHAKLLLNAINTQPILPSAAAEVAEKSMDAASFAAQVAIKALGPEAGHQLVLEADTADFRFANDEVARILALLLEAAHTHQPRVMQGLSIVCEDGVWEVSVADHAAHLHDQEFSFMTLNDTTDIRHLPEILRDRLIALLVAERAAQQWNAQLEVKCVDEMFVVVRLSLPDLALESLPSGDERLSTRTM